MLRQALACLVAGLAACGPGAPSLDDLEPGETGRVVRVFDGDAFLLDNDLAVRLVGVEAPAGAYRDRPAAPGAEASTRMLEDLILGREVKLYYPGLTRDRYGRALAHVETVDDLGPALWVNFELARRGGAWSRAYPDTAALGDRVLAAEAEARTAGRGLWADPAYRIKDAREVEPEARGFHLVRGEIEGRETPEDGRSACRLRLKGAALRVDVDRAAVLACRATGPARVRGYVSEGRLRLTHMLNFEPLAPPPATGP